MIDRSGVQRLPEQELPATVGQDSAKHGYIGDDGEIVVVARSAAGSSNAVPSVEAAQADVDAAERALERAQRSLTAAKQGEAKAKRGESTAPEPGTPPQIGNVIITATSSKEGPQTREVEVEPAGARRGTIVGPGDNTPDRSVRTATATTSTAKTAAPEASTATPGPAKKTAETPPSE